MKRPLAKSFFFFFFFSDSLLCSQENQEVLMISSVSNVFRLTESGDSFRPGRRRQHIAQDNVELCHHGNKANVTVSGVSRGECDLLKSRFFVPPCSVF